MHPSLNFRPYKKLIEQQKTIGWTQIKYRRWSTQWKLLQAQYNPSTELNSWIIAVRQHIHFTLHQQWKYCNSQLHPDRNSEHTRNRLLSCIKAAYTRETEMLEHQKFPFSKTLEEWKTWPTMDMKRWLKHNLPYMKQYIQIQKVQIKNQTKGICIFFPGTATETRQFDKVP